MVMGFSWKCAIGATLGVVLVVAAVVGVSWLIWFYGVGIYIMAGFFALVAATGTIICVAGLWNAIYQRCKTAQRFGW